MTSRLEWIGWVLLVLGFLRAALLVAHDPLMGYANQYDMHRTGACVGLYPAASGADRGKATPQAPISIYRVGAKGEDCYRSSEVVIVMGVLATLRSAGIGEGDIRLQWIGFAKLALLFVTALLIAWALKGHPAATLAHGFVFLLVLADPVVTLWANTLYTEFALILSLYAAIGSICALAISDRPLIVIWIVLVGALLGLAFSREQFALLGPLLLVAAWPWLWYRSERTTAVVFIIAAVASFTSFVVLARPSVVKLVNRADAYLGVVVPAASTPKKGLEMLGLPERCEILSGSSWYTQRGENLHEVCPEVFGLSSYAFAKVAVEEPESLGRALARVLPASQASGMPLLGTIEGGDKVPIRALPWWAASLPDFLARNLPGIVFAALAFAVMLAAPLAFLASIAWARPSSATHGASLMAAMLLGGTLLYALVTATFGDGLSESWRHMLAGTLAMYSALIAFAVGLPFAIRSWIASPRENAFRIAGAVGAVAVGVASWLAVVAWAGRQPLALGTIDTPAGREVPASGFRVTGWTLDPFGVEDVDVEIGSVRLDTGQRAGHGELPWVYPGYPFSSEAAYSVNVTADDIARAGAEPLLRVRVRNRHGVVTEIDRRRLVVAP